MLGEQEPATAVKGAGSEPDPAGVELVELDRATCLRLLATGQVGRIVFTEGALPAAQPVTYLLDGDEVIFRTADGSKLAAATRKRVVAFQVDQIDIATRSGWSVLGVGQAYEVTDPQRLASLPDRGLTPWVPGPLPHTIAVPLQRLTGRRLGPV
jgi:hypothetical protein